MLFKVCIVTKNGIEFYFHSQLSVDVKVHVHCRSVERGSEVLIHCKPIKSGILIHVATCVTFVGVALKRGANSATIDATTSLNTGGYNLRYFCF